MLLHIAIIMESAYLSHNVDSSFCKQNVLWNKTGGDTDSLDYVNMLLTFVENEICNGCVNEGSLTIVPSWWCKGQ
jgi:hypothetical protein